MEEYVGTRNKMTEGLGSKAAAATSLTQMSCQ
jgi:hypothetical protein